MTQDHCQPLTVHRFRAGLDAAGNITGWDNAVANLYMITGSTLEQALMADGMDRTADEVLIELPFGLPAHRVS